MTVLSCELYFISSMTFNYYIGRILGILPTIKQRYEKAVNIFHLFNSLAMLVLAGLIIARAITSYKQFKVENYDELEKQGKTKEEISAAMALYVEQDSECEYPVYLFFELYLLGAFILYFILTLHLKRKVQKLEQSTHIDRKINMQYVKLCRTLMFIVVVQLVSEAVQNMQNIVLNWISGYCFYETCSLFWNNFFFYVTCPLPHLVQITSILFIFWRKKDTNQLNAGKKGQKTPHSKFQNTKSSCAHGILLSQGSFSPSQSSLNCRSIDDVEDEICR